MTSSVYSFIESYGKKGHSDVVDSWPFMGDPIKPTLILAAYLAFVLKIGPALMKNRQAMGLQKTMIVYNGLQVLLSMFIIWKGLRVNVPVISIFYPSCEKQVHYTAEVRLQFAESAWWYHVAKMTEFIDTIIFILRKKNRQASFLHVYHHSVTMYFSWMFLKYTPSEQGGIVGIINSSVHVIMYSYYMVAAMGPAYQKYIWWKKYMTVIQLVQFFIILAYLSLLPFSNCGHSKFVTQFFMANTFIFIYMFLDFYRKAYNKSAKSLAADTLMKAATNGTVHKTSTSSQGFVGDNEAYLQISKDAELLSKAEQMCKVE